VTELERSGKTVKHAHMLDQAQAGSLSQKVRSCCMTLLQTL